ncbi:MAG: hypothetical protein KAR42_07065 [candidate division Zixibacteria bacterium]|nr:hypothetical protein [candidate division Zixibacteria bacterium]
MTWSYTGNTELTVSIDVNNVVTIGIPTVDWNGNEAITFRATDPGTEFAEDAATFTVTAEGDAPVVTDITDQTIAEGATFTTITLDDFVSDVDNTDAEMTWSYSGNTELTVSIDVNRIATITIPSVDWNGNETITFRATDPGALFAEDAATFTVTAVNDAPIMTDILDQTIAEGASFTTFDLDDFVSDVDNTDAELTWSYTGNTELTVSIDVNNVVTIGIPTVDWNGNETITFRATDPGTEFAEDAATFTVTAVNDAPIMTDILDQTIAEGASFTTFDLDDFVSDVDNTDAEMTWSYTGNTELTVSIDVNNIATIGIPTVDWNGNETITFRATDPGTEFAEDAATFTVTAEGDAPVVTDITDQTIAEGATFTTITLDDFVSDVDNTDAEMTWSYTGNTELTVSIDVNRIATITIPSVDWNGNETITFRATDPGALFAEDAAIFTVTAVNDAPIMTDILDQTIAEGASFTTFDLDDFVSDVDNTDAEMTWSYTGNTELTVSIDVNNIATIGIPTVDWNGNETITFRATDPGTEFAEDAATFTVTAVNDAPIMTDILDQTIAEGSSFTTFDLDDFVSDVDNTDAELTWSYTGNTELTVSIDVNNVVTIGIPTVDWNGNETITFRATDPGTEFAEDAVTFTVTAEGDAPVVTDITDQTIAEGATFTTITLDDFVSDVDNTDAEMTWSYTGNTELTVSIDVNRIATITIPSVDWNGNETITFRATDPGALFAEDAAIFTVTAVNDAPVMTDILDQTIAEGASFTTFDLDDFVSDIDNTDAEMTWSYTGNTELTVSIDVNNVVTIGIPTVDWNGNETITFRATDPGALFAEDAATFTVTAVNDAPVLDPIGAQAVVEGGNLNFTVTASDIDGTTPVLSTSTPLPANATFDAGTGVFDFNPDFTQESSYDVTFYASDGTEIDSEIVTINVTATNQDPLLDPIGAQTIAEGANLNFTVTASDPDGTTPILSTSTPLPANATFDAGTGVFDFNPDFLQAGSFNVTFYAADGIAIDSEIVTITVTEAGNQAPILDPIGAQAVSENSNLNFTITASDPDGTTPTLSAEPLPANATFDAGTGLFDFNPDFTQEGSYDVIFKAFDGVLVDSEVVTITVLGTNQVPILDAITTPQAVNEGDVLSFTVTASDPDGTTPVLSTSTPLPANATFDAGTGAFDFSPDFTQAGAHAITFYAGDGTDTDSQLVTINVGDGGNQAPVLVEIGALFITEGVNLNLVITAIDPDGTIPTMTAENLPVNATYVDNGDGSGTFDFTPDFTQAGVYGVTFITSDGVMADSELVLLSVTELGNQAPVMATVVTPQVVNENDTLTIALSATDPDSDSVFFSYTFSGGSEGFTLTDNLDGTATLVYMPDYSSAGIDTLRIFATDDGSPQLSDIEVIEIITVEINQPPSIEPVGPFGLRVGRTLEFTITASDSTAEAGSRVFLTVSGMPANATFVDNGDNTGSFSFTPDNSQAGEIAIRFIAIDDTDPPMSAFLDVVITVVETNNAPVFDDILPQMVAEGNTLIFSVTATDADGVIPTLTAEDVPDGASFVDNGDGTGTFTYLTTFTSSGLYGVDFRATDGIDITKKTVLVQVIDAGNQAPIMTPIAPQTVTEALLLTFGTDAVDPDGTIPTFTADSLPNGSVFQDNGDGTCSFNWEPDYSQEGTYNLYIFASDGELVDTAIVAITVDDAGNQTPSLDPILDVTISELGRVRFTVTTADVDGIVPILTASALPGTAQFTDNGDFTGEFDWTTTQDDAGVYSITITATDGEDAGITVQESFDITVNDVNRAPYLIEIPPNQTKSVDEGGTLTYNLTGFDDDGVVPIIGMNVSQPNFNIVNNGDGTATLTITPDYTQGGITQTNYSIVFIAYDGDTVNYPDDFGTFGPVNFTIVNVPVAPVLDPIGAQTVTEGDTLDIVISATDLGGSTIVISTENVPLNGGLISGTGSPRTFRFIPSFVQTGNYDVLFIANNGSLTDSETVTITVLEAGNQAPVFRSATDTTVMLLGETIEFHIVAEDPDGDAITLSMISPPANTTFVDSANGAGSLTFIPDAAQNGATHIMRFEVVDPAGLTDTLFKWVRVTTFVRGDANDDGSVNIGDAVFIIDYVFRGGNPPAVMYAADVNNDGVDGPMVNVGDALYLVNFIFRAGPPPIE